jgi:hypothetical protein
MASVLAIAKNVRSATWEPRHLDLRFVAPGATSGSTAPS